MNPKVDAYLHKIKQWQEETEKLRHIALSCGLTEELKWGKPCYTYEDKNVVIIQGFKEYIALLFFKGVLLQDPDGILTKTGANTHVGRQIRFTNVKEITKQSALLKKYIRQAIEVEKSGSKVPVKKTAAITMPEELTEAFRKQPDLKAAFHALTPGRQKGYIFYFSQAKQSATRATRIQKSAKKILDGKGLLDR